MRSTWTARTTSTLSRVESSLERLSGLKVFRTKRRGYRRSTGTIDTSGTGRAHFHLQPVGAFALSGRACIRSSETAIRRRTKGVNFSQHARSEYIVSPVFKVIVYDGTVYVSVRRWNSIRRARYGKYMSLYSEGDVKGSQ